MKNKGKILTFIFITIGILPIFVFAISVLSPSYPTVLLSDVPKEANYYVSPEFGFQSCLTRPNSEAIESDLFLIGDSFIPHFDEIIESKTDKNVFTMFSHESMIDGRKIESLFNHVNFKKLLETYHIPEEKARSRKFVLVSIERFVFDRLGKSLPERPAGFIDNTSRIEQLEKYKIAIGLSNFRDKLTYYPPLIYDNFVDRGRRYGFMWQKSSLSFGLSQGLKKMRRSFWGKVIKLEVIKKGDWNFVEKSFINYERPIKRTPLYINKVVNNLLSIKKMLKKDYNLELVFMPIPDKISVYGDQHLENNYDGYLSKLYEELEKNDVPVVNLLDEFRNQKDTLYFKNDAHWNKKGLELGVDILLEKLKQ